jgi:Uri superfamily endonuclease
MQLPQVLIDDLSNTELAGGEWFSPAGALPEIPDGLGAYLLLIGLAQPVVLNASRFAGLEFPAGWYVYAGSAKGPGGLHARVARHLRRDKRAHWHVDHLTDDASVMPLCFPGTDECSLMDALIAASAFTIPAPGFGSTDCRRCDSHLVRWA